MLEQLCFCICYQIEIYYWLNVIIFSKIIEFDCFVTGYNCPQISQPQQMSLSVDPKNVYNPPSSLQYPGVEEDSPVRPESPPSTSSSHSDLSSPSFNRDSELELNPKIHEGSQSTNVSARSFSSTILPTFSSLSVSLCAPLSTS